MTEHGWYDEQKISTGALIYNLNAGLCVELSYLLSFAPITVDE